MPSKKAVATSAPKQRTQKQIDASRRNGARSRGPVTPQGKDAVRRNAVKHGLRAAPGTVRELDSEAYANHRRFFIDELRPEGILECELAELYIFSSYQLNRVRVIEIGQDILPALGQFGSMPNLARYRSSLERTRDRAYRQLKELQTERCLRDAPYTSRKVSEIPRLVPSQAYKRRRMEYDIDHGLDPHSPHAWPKPDNPQPVCLPNRPAEPPSGSPQSLSPAPAQTPDESMRRIRLKAYNAALNAVKDLVDARTGAAAPLSAALSPPPPCQACGAHHSPPPPLSRPGVAADCESQAALPGRVPVAQPGLAAEVEADRPNPIS